MKALHVFTSNNITDSGDLRNRLHKILKGFSFITNKKAEIPMISASSIY